MAIISGGDLVVNSSNTYRYTFFCMTIILLLCLSDLFFWLGNGAIINHYIYRMWIVNCSHVPAPLPKVKGKIWSAIASAQLFKTAKAVLLQATSYLTVFRHVGWANSFIVCPPYACIAPAMRDAERHRRHSHAERGNDKLRISLPFCNGTLFINNSITYKHTSIMPI